MAWCFAGIVLLLVAASIIQPDRKISDEENRILTTFPKPSIENIKNKEYMTALEDYSSDQFILRDLWIRLKVRCDLLVGKREFNGVYLGKKKYLMQIPVGMDEKNTKENLEAMNQFRQKNSNLRMNALIVPNAAYIMKDYLPLHFRRRTALLYMPPQQQPPLPEPAAELPLPPLGLHIPLPVRLPPPAPVLWPSLPLLLLMLPYLQQQSLH